jgi:tungstate transport system ATP-binding protein
MLRLSIKGITKGYDGKEVLKDCTFEFERGVYALMGPNGSGKSTLLRICALLERPDRGAVSYRDGGTKLEEDISLRRRVTLVLPRAGIFNASVFNNAAYGLKVRGVPKRKMTERANEALRTVGLLDKAGQNALTVSSGESQRLAMARAMVLEPDVLFLDEPTASVDEENTEIIEKLILDMRTRGAPMVVMATHDREQAQELADEIITMKKGRLLANDR